MTAGHSEAVRHRMIAHPAPRIAAPIFLRADFLACAAILGAGCAIIRWRTASLWPAVILHWLMVVVWQTWLGGAGVGALR